MVNVERVCVRKITSWISYFVWPPCCVTMLPLRKKMMRKIQCHSSLKGGNVLVSSEPNSLIYVICQVNLQHNEYISDIH